MTVGFFQPDPDEFISVVLWCCASQEKECARTHWLSGIAVHCDDYSGLPD